MRGKATFLQGEAPFRGLQELRLRRGQRLIYAGGGGAQLITHLTRPQKAEARERERERQRERERERCKDRSPRAVVECQEMSAKYVLVRMLPRAEECPGPGLISLK